MEQKSKNWLEWRLNGIGSSDAPVIMGVSPYQTRFQLWEVKTGLKIPEEMPSFVMERGITLEPIARAKYELENNIDMPDECCAHKDISWLRASMDGVNFEVGGGLEIKYLGENDFALAQTGVVPDRYFPQLMHQFLVTGLKWIDFYGYNVPKDAENHAGKSVVIRVYPDAEYIQKLFKEEEAFWKLVQSETPPAFTDGDYKSIRVKGAKALANEYIAISKDKNRTKNHRWRESMFELLALADGYERVRIYNIRIEYANGARVIKIMEDDK